jgi:signal transduction histidine kinase
MGVSRDPDRDTLGSVTRLRLAALLGLGAIALFLPLELHYASADDVPLILTVYAIHATLAGGVALLSYTEWGARHADGMALFLALAMAANHDVFFYLRPRHPALVAETFTILMIAAALLFPWSVRRMLLLCGLICAGFAAVAWRSTLPGTPFGLAFVPLLIGAAIAVVSARLFGVVRAALARHEAELAALSARLMALQEEERRRLSRELHDELGQSLTAVMSYLWLIEQQGDDADAVRSRAGEARRLAAKTLTAMRELSQLLRPSSLDDYGLIPSLDALVRSFGGRHQIAATFAADGLPDRFPPDIETAVYRIAQEALTNVARHARASRVQVVLAAERGSLRLDVEDNGVGLAGRTGAEGTGVISIRERVRALGGTVSIASAGGVHLTVHLPLAGRGALPTGAAGA